MMKRLVSPNTSDSDDEGGLYRILQTRMMKAACTEYFRLMMKAACLTEALVFTCMSTGGQKQQIATCM